MSYALYIGKNHTADGIAYLAGYGDEPSSHWLDIVPQQDHAPGATVTVGVTPQAELPGCLCEIPQVVRTARHVRVSYSHYRGIPAPLTNGGLNQHSSAFLPEVLALWQAVEQRLVLAHPAFWRLRRHCCGLANRTSRTPISPTTPGPNCSPHWTSPTPWRNASRPAPARCTGFAPIPNPCHPTRSGSAVSAGRRPGPPWVRTRSARGRHARNARTTRTRRPPRLRGC